MGRSPGTGTSVLDMISLGVQYQSVTCEGNESLLRGAWKENVGRELVDYLMRGSEVSDLRKEIGRLIDTTVDNQLPLIG